MAHWYTVDLHFGHEAIIGLCKRPFPSAALMDGALLGRVDKMDSPGRGRDDSSWHLGWRPAWHET